MEFGAKLRHIRLAKEWTQEELAQRLGTSKQVISRYETGKRSPRISIVAEYANALGVTLESLVDDKREIVWLSELTNEYKVRRDHRELHLVSTYRRLNLDGQEIVVTTAEGLDKSGMYKAETSVSMKDYSNVYTVGQVAAGHGSYLDSHDDTHRRVKSEDIPRYDVAVDVSGNSMCPNINDGDIAYIKKSFDKVSGKIYAVTVDDVSYIKRAYFEKDKLILRSDNADFDDIIISGTDLESTYIEGRVVAWTTPE